MKIKGNNNKLNGNETKRSCILPEDKVEMKAEKIKKSPQKMGKFSQPRPPEWVDTIQRLMAKTAAVLGLPQTTKMMTGRHLNHWRIFGWIPAHPKSSQAMG